MKLTTALTARVQDLAVALGQAGFAIVIGKDTNKFIVLDNHCRQLVGADAAVRAYLIDGTGSPATVVARCCSEFDDDVEDD